MATQHLFSLLRLGNVARKASFGGLKNCGYMPIFDGRKIPQIVNLAKRDFLKYGQSLTFSPFSFPKH